jgi:hypothetical protein
MFDSFQVIYRRCKFSFMKLVVFCIINYIVHSAVSLLASASIGEAQLFYRMHMRQCNCYHILPYFCWVGIWLSSTKNGQDSISLEKAKKNYLLISIGYSILLVMHDIPLCLYHFCFVITYFICHLLTKNCRMEHWLLSREIVRYSGILTACYWTLIFQ